MNVSNQLLAPAPDTNTVNSAADFEEKMFKKNSANQLLAPAPETPTSVNSAADFENNMFKNTSALTGLGSALPAMAEAKNVILATDQAGGSDYSLGKTLCQLNRSVT